MNTDSELLSFAAQVLERFGGIIELQKDSLITVLPENLARTLNLPEETQLGGEKFPLLYGSPLLDRLIHVTTQNIPLLFGRIEVPYLKKAGFEQQLSQDFVFTNARVHVAGRAEARTTYMHVICRYIALSDERKEGLVEIGVQENTGAVIQDFEQLWSQPQHKAEFYQQGGVPPHFPVRVEKSISKALQNARSLAEDDLTEFITSMKRRLRRDVKNTKEYYDALRKEMEASLSHPNLSEVHKQERMSKIQELPDEMQRKIEDLQQKYTIKMTLRGCGILRFLVDVAKVMVDIHHKKFTRTEHLIWNPLTGRFDPLVCEQCSKTIREIHFRPQKTDIQFVCSSCSLKN